MADVVNTPDFTQQFFNLDGKPLVNGKLAFFENNTDIPASVYTSGGSVALGSEITLDSSGFPETQFALEAGKEYTVKAFDSDNVLIWTRNNVFGGGSSGVSGDFVPMTGTSIGDPIVGPLVLQDTPGAVLDVRNTVSKTGSVLMDTFGGQTSYSRNGVDIQMVNTRGEYLYNKARLQNTQNGFPGYPDYSELSILDLKLHRELDDSGSRKEKSLNLSIDSTIYNTIESKGANLNVNCDKSFLVQAPAGVVNLIGQNIELTPSNYSGFVYVNNNGTLRTQWLSLGTHNYHQDVSEIYTSTTTGDPSDYQLITAKAALEAASGMSNPMTDEGDMIIGGVDGAPERLQFGLRGQLLVMGDDGKPEWSEKPSACQENYSIVDSTGIYSASSYNDQIITSKVIANFDRVYSQIGFGLKTGQMSIPGQVGLAIYDVGKNLVARTPIFQITETYLGQVYWADTENTFSLSAGNEYYFAFWTSNYPASNLIQFLGHQQVSSFDADLVGIYYGQSGLTEMPNSLSIPSIGQMVVHMAVR